MRDLDPRVDNDKPLGYLIYGSHNYAYLITKDSDGLRCVKPFAWMTDADRRPYSGELERVRKMAEQGSGWKDF